MGQAQKMQPIDQSTLRRLETHFIAPEIYQRRDVPTRQAKLARIVSAEIVPRLLALHSDALPDAPPPEKIVAALAPGTDDVTGLADIVLGNDLEAAVAYVMVLRDRGLSPETLFIELLEPTARHLGAMWDRDECDFIDVTLGVARLQKLLSIFNATHELPALDERRCVLMAMTPGDQHFFGVTMVEKFLRAGGWRVEAEHEASAAQLADATARQWFAVAGLTLGSERHVDAMRETIAEVRARSRNPAIGVMVGGPLFTANPALVREVGADATAPNAPAAVLVAQKLFDEGALAGWAARAGR